MIPTGPIYDKLKILMYGLYSDKCYVSPVRGTSFDEWFRNGSYIVDHTDNNNIHISTNKNDLALILLREIECLCNQCFEHIHELYCYYDDDRVRSDAWGGVTTYYYGFYAAQALLRLIGKPVVFMGKERIDNINALSSSGANASGGVYVLDSINDETITNTLFIFKRKKNGKPHEATWLTLMGLIKDIIIKNMKTCKATKEFLFYDNIAASVLFKIYTNYEWPSAVRNRANYSVGFAYRTIDGETIAKTKNLMQKWLRNDMDCEGIISESVDKCKTENDDYSFHVCLLNDVSHSIFLVFRALYEELFENGKINKVWENKRKVFLVNKSESEKNCKLVRTF